MKTYDLIIVGAGPGGSNAAATALGAGLTVLQIDRRKFPRVKPCAGALTMKCIKALRLDLEPSVRSRFAEFQFNLWGNRSDQFRHRRIILKMVLRSELDNHFVEQNRRWGNFTFFDGESARKVEYEGRAFRVHTDRRELTGRQLIGADGAYSVVNRMFGISRPKGRATACEVYLYKSRAQLKRPLPPCFDYGAIDRGYGWVFPKDDHWSVGLYTLNRHLKDVREHLRAYIADKGFTVKGDPLSTFEAYQLPVGGYRFTVPDAPVYVVGDAGGFADAITGEGIYYAIESGRLAGMVAAKVADGRGTHKTYYRRLWLSVLPDTFLTYQLSKWVYRNPVRALRILENPLVWRPLVEGYSQGATFTKCVLLGGLYLARSFRKASLTVTEKTRSR